MMLRLNALVAITLWSLTGCVFNADGVAGSGDNNTSQTDGQVTGDGGPPGDSTSPDDGSTQCNPPSCPLGCHPTLDRCNRLDPSNLDVQDFHDQITGNLSLAMGDQVTVNGDTGSIVGNSITYRATSSQGEVRSGIYWDIRDQPGGGSIAVFGVDSLTIPAGAILILTGNRPIAIYVRTDADIEGVITASAQERSAGPGGGNGGGGNGAAADPCGSGSEGGPGQETEDLGTEFEAGGGGGGYGGVGAKGGDADWGLSFAAAGLGGANHGNVELLPLTGGCGGGSGGGAGHQRRLAQQRRLWRRWRRRGAARSGW